jgi:accessory gene regulator protein AgrB
MKLWCVVKYTGIYLAMFIAYFVGVILLFVGTLYAAALICEAIFGSDVSSSITTTVWGILVITCMCLIGAIITCYYKDKKKHGRKNPRIIDEL